MTQRYVPIEEAQPLVKHLKRHYGSLSQAATATGINYRTLQGILQPGKHRQTSTETLGKLEAAVAKPPVKVPSPWERQHIDVERLRPLVLYLEKTYGNLTDAATATGIDLAVLRSVKYRQYRGIKNAAAIKVVRAVQSLRHNSLRRWSTYENEEPPHLPNEQESEEASQAKARWRSVERIGERIG